MSRQEGAPLAGRTDDFESIEGCSVYIVEGKIVVAVRKTEEEGIPENGSVWSEVDPNGAIQK